VKALETLIKLARTKVEDKQKQIAAYREAIAKLEGRIAELERTIVAEEAAAKASPELAAHFGAFHQRALRQIDGLKADIRTQEAELQPHLDMLAELYAEQKRVEILHARRLAEARKLRQKKEQAELDEIAAVRHARAQADKE
jgi:flagellar export protein FliJ